MVREVTALYWENPKNQRYYAIEFKQDLLLDWILVRTNGKRGTRLGQMKQIVCQDYEAGLKLIEDIKKRRIKRGYDLISSSN